MDPLEESRREVERLSRVMAGDHSDDDPKTQNAATPEGMAADAEDRL